MYSEIDSVNVTFIDTMLIMCKTFVTHGHCIWGYTENKMMENGGLRYGVEEKMER